MYLLIINNLANNIHSPCLGAARLTQIMLPLIRRTNGRIVFLSSGKSSIIYQSPGSVLHDISIPLLSLPSLQLCLASQHRFVEPSAPPRPDSKVSPCACVTRCDRVALTSLSWRPASSLPALPGWVIRLCWTRYILKSIFGTPLVLCDVVRANHANGWRWFFGWIA